MTDYTDLEAELQVSLHVNDQLRARIAELEVLYDKLHVETWEAQRARIAELEEKLADEEYVSKDTNEMFHEVRDENIELRARIAELEAALKRLHDAALDIDVNEMSPTERDWWLDELRAARAALEKTDG